MQALASAGKSSTTEAAVVLFFCISRHNDSTPHELAQIEMIIVKLSSLHDISVTILRTRVHRLDFRHPPDLAHLHHRTHERPRPPAPDQVRSSRTPLSGCQVHR